MKQIDFHPIEFSPHQLIVLADETINEASEYQPHTHDWGQIIFVKCGVIIMNVEQERFIAPAGFAIWIPPNSSHACYNHQPTRFRSINIHAHAADELTRYPSLLQLSPIALSILDYFFDHQILQPHTPEDHRKTQVIIDELHGAMIGHTYLPTSNHRLLYPIMTALEKNPAIRLTLKEWADKVFTTERTLARYFQRELDMSFNEWCRRLRFIHGLALLEQGATVEEIAFKVGYRSASSFIAMFQALSGTTPDRYRQKLT